MNRIALHVVLCVGLAFAATANTALAADSVRPEVGKPLQAAQALLKQRKAGEAMAEIAKAEAVPNRTPYENQVIAQMKAAVASASGDNDATIRANQALLDSGKVSGREATMLVQGIAVAHYNKKEYAEAAKWAQRYFKDGGTDASMRTVLLQSYYLSGDCTTLNKTLGNGEERRLSEEDLLLLRACFDHQKDTTNLVATIEKLVVSYPKKEYWNELLARMQRKPGFASDRLGIHVYRLRMATGMALDTNDYMEMAQLALQAGVPAEAKAIVDKGYDAKALGNGKEAERHQRLRDLVNKSLAESQKNRAKEEADAMASKDGNDLVKVGLNYVYEGKPDKGLPLIDQGIKRGGLRRPEDAKLLYGEALLQAGQKAKAAAVFRDVKGNDGTADLARLWILEARA